MSYQRARNHYISAASWREVAAKLVKAFEGPFGEAILLNRPLTADEQQALQASLTARARSHISDR
jgi:hypothetical protein